MLGFSQVFKLIEWQELLEQGKMGTIRFEQAQGFILPKKYFGVRGTFSFVEGKFELQRLRTVIARLFGGVSDHAG